MDTNATLQQEADTLLERVQMRQLLAAYESWFVGGSHSYDLMCWRDLDLYVLDPTYNLESCFTVAKEVTQRLAARKSRFTNNLGQFEDGPSGLYWGIRLGDSPFGDWKLDIWFLAKNEYENHIDYAKQMRRRLNDESREAILSIKKSYWQRSEFRKSVTSDLIYRAVLDEGVRTPNEFESFVKRRSRGL